MSLRARYLALRQPVEQRPAQDLLHVAAPRACNMQQTGIDHATRHATAAQQPAANPHECLRSSATGKATTAQQPPENRATTVQQQTHGAATPVARFDGLAKALAVAWPKRDARQALRTCATCLNLLQRGTCAEPVAAGLVSEADGFGIAWPPEGHDATCPGFVGRAPAPPQDRPYRLTKAEAGTAHADEWDDAAIARFQARATEVQRRGFTAQDADDLAERLLLRDVHADYRHLCLECRHLAGTAATGWRCGSHKSADVARELPAELVTMFQGCAGFAAKPGGQSNPWQALAA